MKDDRTPRDIAIDDQLRAAGAEGADWLMASGWGAPVTIPVQKAARWQREARARMLAAEASDTWTFCKHLCAGGPQPVVVHAETPERMLCRACSIAERATRPCLICGKPAASESPADGREDVIMGPVAIYTRLRCATCYRADPLHGTFAGSGF
ncbi:hypothetical protein [Kitasatospora aureofaciens]|uniref:hypothetical protein n=1 Tax=Kitasatospora aureofaciens TaxID=1894 RepID=UPI001C469E7D|nr:hypothetical protein [Kitasatospora aureofaciens]MBV6699640.1 hypothetical protein [Kitasatospora aureofaciens]